MKSKEGKWTEIMYDKGSTAKLFYFFPCKPGKDGRAYSWFDGFLR